MQKSLDGCGDKRHKPQNVCFKRLAFYWKGTEEQHQRETDPNCKLRISVLHDETRWFLELRTETPSRPPRPPSLSSGSCPLLPPQNPYAIARSPAPRTPTPTPAVLLLFSLASTRFLAASKRGVRCAGRGLHSHFGIAFLSSLSSLLSSPARLSPPGLLLLDLCSDEDLGLRAVLWGASVSVRVVQRCFRGPSGSGSVCLRRSLEGRVVCPHTLPHSHVCHSSLTTFTWVCHSPLETLLPVSLVFLLPGEDRAGPSWQRPRSLDLEYLTCKNSMINLWTVAVHICILLIR